MTLSAFNALNSAINSRLTSGTALVSALGGTAIYHGYAPENRALPFVVWSYSGGGAENMTPNASVNEVIYIRAYATTAKKAAQIDAQVALLMETDLSLTGWNNYWLAREDELYLPELDDAGKTTWSCGAYYRVRLD
jgi:hypothetical protein